MKTIQIHPIAEIFPSITSEELKDLTRSITEHGLQHPITIYQGKILDGRHRDQACRMAGVEPAYVQYKGNDPLGFAISTNLDRRHLSVSQRSIIAAKIAALKQGEAGRKIANSHKTPANHQTANLQFGEIGPTCAEAAERLNVSERSVNAASKILSEAPKSVISAVETGKMSVHAAEKIVDAKRANKTDVCDATDYLIPEDLVPIWLRRNEVLDLMKRIASVEQELAERQKAKDVLFSTIAYSDVRSQLQFAHGEIRGSQIYAVCTSCQGRNRQSCRHCKGRGFLSKQQWDFVPSEIKSIRGAK